MARRLQDEQDPLSVEIDGAFGEVFGPFVEAASRGRHRDPIHFRPFVERLQEIEAMSGARDVWAAPVQHGKTTLAEYALPLILLRHPDRSLIYLTFTQRKAEKHSRRMRSIFTQCGGRIQSDFNTIQEWRTDEGGGLFVTSVNGELTGNTAHHAFYDDPYASREEAENSEYRELIEDKFSAELVSRIVPGGSITINASRWDEDDLSGVKIREGYRHTHLKAISEIEIGKDEDGDPIIQEQALCPWGPDPKAPRDLEFLRNIRDTEVKPWDWASLYQGEPSPRGASLFGPAHLITQDELDTHHVRQWFVGGDLAWSTRRDRIVALVLAVISPELAIVVHVRTWQNNIIEKLEEFRDEIRPWPHAVAGAYVSGPEIGVIKGLRSLSKDLGGPLKIHPMSTGNRPKYARAGNTAFAWNKGQILVLANQPWTNDFIRVVKAFTGIEGARDDETDALVSAFDLSKMKAAFKDSFGGRKR